MVDLTNISLQNAFFEVFFFCFNKTGEVCFDCIYILLAVANIKEIYI